jgi:hypothetical protein
MEIRRIREDEGEEVAALWQRLGGGVLTPERQARIARMLSATAWRRELFTLVAVGADGALAGVWTFRTFAEREDAFWRDRAWECEQVLYASYPG